MYSRYLPCSNIRALSWVCWQAAGFIGTVLIGRVLQKGFYQTLVVIPLLMAATALAVVQLSIALGSTVGGLLFDVSGYSATFIASAVLLVVCAVSTAITARKTVVHH